MSGHYEGQAVDCSEVFDHATIIPEFGDGSLTSLTDEKDNFETDDDKNKHLWVPNNSKINETNISSMCFDQKDQAHTTNEYPYIVPAMDLKSPPQKKNINECVKQVTFQSSDTVDYVQDTTSCESNERIQNTSGRAKLRVKSRACSSIRRIQEKLQTATSEQCQSIQGYVKSTATPSNTSGLNMIRRQRSRSRASKYNRHGVTLIQRPYRRWLGVSTCLSDARYIVNSKKKSACKSTSPDTDINSSDRKREQFDVKATCYSDQGNRSVKKDVDNILSDKLTSHVVENTGVSSPVNGFIQNQSAKIPLTDDDRCLENLQEPFSSSPLNATISLSSSGENIQNNVDAEHYSSENETDEIQSHHSLQSDIEKHWKNAETRFIFEDEKPYSAKWKKNMRPTKLKKQRCSNSTTVQLKDAKCKPSDENESVYEEEGLDIMDEAGNLKKSQQKKINDSTECKPVVEAPVRSGPRTKRVKIKRYKNHPHQEYQKAHVHDPLPAKVLKKKIISRSGLSPSFRSKSAVPSLDPDKDSFRQDGGLAGNVVAITQYQFMDPPPVITQEKRGRQRVRKAIPFDGINGINPLREEMRQYLQLGLHPTRPKPSPSSALQRLVKRSRRKDESKAEYYNVQAIKSFEGKLPGQLSFEKGQILKQLDTGLLPKNGMNYGYYRIGRLKRKKAGLYPCSHVTCQVVDDNE